MPCLVIADRVPRAQVYARRSLARMVCALMPECTTMSSPPPLRVEMVDQTTRGHQFLIKEFGPDAVPRGTWQIDPLCVPRHCPCMRFLTLSVRCNSGHSNTQAWLLGAEAGMDSLFWGRTDYQVRTRQGDGRRGLTCFTFVCRTGPARAHERKPHGVGVAWQPVPRGLGRTIRRRNLR